MNQYPIGFIGGGHMAFSLIHGLIESGHPPNLISVADPNLLKRQRFLQLGVQVQESSLPIFEALDIIVLAIKPDDIKKTAHLTHRFAPKPNALLISIAAGITSKQLHTWFNGRFNIIRAMPNTPALVGAGATGLYADTTVSETHRELAESLMRSVGATVWVNHEHDMDTVTALSGSGPAYFFLMISALQQAAEELGLPAATAKILTLQTALGAARMAMENDVTIEELIARVTSKGGTTEEALSVLKSGDIEALFKKALSAARNRSKEISDQLRS